MRFKLIFFILLLLLPFTDSEFATAGTLERGYGWYVDGTEEEAVRKSLEMMDKGVKTPEFVVLYTTVGYDTERVIDSLRSRVGKAPKIFGMTSCWGVITTDGVHAGEKASLAVLGISSDTSDFGIAGTSIQTIESVKDAATDEIRKAVLDAGRNPGDIPDLVLMAASPGIEEEVLKGISAVVGNQVPVYGGSAADNTLEGKWRVFSNDKVFQSGFSIAVIFSTNKIGAAFHSGYLGSSKNAVATDVKDDESRTLQTLDGRPAAEVYNEWAYDKFDEQLEHGGSVLGPASFYPLARRIQGNDRSHFIGIHPSVMIKNDKSIDLFANVEKGCRLFFTEGTPDALIHRPGTITRRALVNGRIKKSDAGLGLFIYCGGTMLAVQDRINEIVPIINKTLGPIPYIGAFTFGEQGNIPGYGNFHGNLMSSMIVVEKGR